MKSKVGGFPTLKIRINSYKINFTSQNVQNDHKVFPLLQKLIVQIQIIILRHSFIFVNCKYST